MPAGFEFPAKVGSVGAGRARCRESQPHVSQLLRRRPVARWRERRAGNADISAIAKDIVRRSDEQGDYLMTDAAAVPLQTSLTGRVGSTLYVLLGAVFFLLLVACANVTNLLLSQAAARGRELAIRHALGAGRGRAHPSVRGRSVLLLIVGCCAGLLVAWAGISALLSLAPADLPRLDEVSLSWPVLALRWECRRSSRSGLGSSRPRERHGTGSSRDARPTAAAARSARRASARAARSSPRSWRLPSCCSSARRCSAAVCFACCRSNPGFRTDGIVAMDLGLPDSSDPAAKARLSRSTPTSSPAARDSRRRGGRRRRTPCRWTAACPTGCSPSLRRRRRRRRWRTSVASFSRRSGRAPRISAPRRRRTSTRSAFRLIRGRLFDDRDQPGQPHVALISRGARAFAMAGRGSDRPHHRVRQHGRRSHSAHHRRHRRRHARVRARAGAAADDVRELDAAAAIHDDRRDANERRSRHGRRRPRAAVLHDLAPDVPPRFRTFAQITPRRSARGGST